MFTLGRDIDIHYPTNRLILIIAAISGLVGSLLFTDLITGLKIAGAVFLTWVLTRETEPKREYAAFMSVVITLLFIFLTDVVVMAGFIELLYIILLLRIINTTSGKHPTLIDAGVLLLLASYLSYSQSNLLYLSIYFIGLFISQIFKDHPSLNNLSMLTAAISILYILYAFITKATFSSPILSTFTLILLLGLYLFSVYSDRTKKIYDDGGNVVESNKIFKAQVFFTVIVFLLIFLSKPFVVNMIVYIASIVGAVIYRPLSKQFHFEDS